MSETTSRYIMPSAMAVGSCYLVKQSPGSEMVGGLQVTLTRRGVGTGLEIALIDRAGVPISDDVSWLTEAVTKAVHDYAAEHDLDFSGCKVKLSHFLYHVVDSSSVVFYQATQSALRSALEALEFRRFESQVKSSDQST